MSKEDKTKLNGIAEGAQPGTITGINMNGASKGTSGVVDLGTVITAVKTLNNTSLVGSGNISIPTLPSVTSSDNGMILKVVGGVWAKANSISPTIEITTQGPVATSVIATSGSQTVSCAQISTSLWRFYPDTLGTWSITTYSGSTAGSVVNVSVATVTLYTVTVYVPTTITYSGQSRESASYILVNNQKYYGTSGGSVVNRSGLITIACFNGAVPSTNESYITLNNTRVISANSINQMIYASCLPTQNMSIVFGKGGSSSYPAYNATGTGSCANINTWTEST